MIIDVTVSVPEQYTIFRKVRYIAARYIRKRRRAKGKDISLLELQNADRLISHAGPKVFLGCINFSVAPSCLRSGSSPETKSTLLADRINIVLCLQKQRPRGCISFLSSNRSRLNGFLITFASNCLSIIKCFFEFYVHSAINIKFVFSTFIPDSKSTKSNYRRHHYTIK